MDILLIFICYFRLNPLGLIEQAFVLQRLLIQMSHHYQGAIHVFYVVF